MVATEKGDLNTTNATDTNTLSAQLPKEHKPLYISTKLIRSNPLNPRTEMDREADAQLRQSIAVKGIETPIHVRPIEEDNEGHIYEVYDGDRRLKAAKKVKIATVPCIIAAKTDDEVREFGLTSIIRRGLGDIEVGRALVGLLRDYPHKYKNQRAMAHILVISSARINQLVKLVTNLDNEVQDLIAPADQSQRIPEGSIDGRIGYEISKISDKERQRELAKEIINEPKLKGDKARLFVMEAREEPETPIQDITARRLAHLQEKSHTNLVMSAEDYDRIMAGNQRVVVEKNLRPGIHENTIIDPLLKAPEPLEVLDVFRRPIGRFNDEDAKSAGFKDLISFKEAWISKRGMAEFNPQETVYVVMFKHVEHVERTAKKKK